LHHWTLGIAMQVINRPQPKASRRWFQLRFRTWLMFAAAVAVPLAIYGHSIERWWRTPSRISKRPVPMLKRVPYCCGGNRQRDLHPLVVHPRIVIREEEEEKLGIDLGP
jgi:hypothetical protein